MAVSIQYAEERAKELAQWICKNLTDEQIEFFNFYAVGIDFCNEPVQGMSQGQWDYFLDTSTKKELRERISKGDRPARVFLSKEQIRDINWIIGAGEYDIYVHHHEFWQILAITRAILQNVEYSISKPPNIHYKMLPEKWWCAEGEKLQGLIRSS